MRAKAPSDDPDALLKRAIHFGDLYNWADAGPLFVQAEELYAARGDKRDALYAHLGRMRSTMEQLSLPEVSEELENALEGNPLLQSDRELRLFCLMVLGDIDGEIDAAPMRRDWEAALKVAHELIDQSRARQKHVKETQALITAGTVANARADRAKAIELFKEAIDLAQKGRFTRLLADAQFYLEDMYRKKGDLRTAESLASAAAEATQSSGDLYLLPMRLQALAQLQASQGKYREASDTYDRASDILDTMIGNVTSAAGKIGLVSSMSNIYTEHFALTADKLKDTTKAFSVLEHARGRVTAELLTSGAPPDS